MAGVVCFYPTNEESLRSIVEWRLGGGMERAVEELLRASSGTKEGTTPLRTEYYSEALIDVLRRDEDSAADFCSAGGHGALKRLVAEADELACEMVAATGITFPAPRTLDRRRGPERVRVGNGVELWIRSVHARQSAQCDTGFVVWPAAKILARWVAANPSFCSGKNVVELGAGAGVVGLAAASVAGSVVLTEVNDECLRNLDYNARLNPSPCPVTVERLDFSNDLDGPLLDRVLASDVICRVDDAKALARFLGRRLAGVAVLLVPDTRNRWGVEALPPALAKQTGLSFAYEAVRDPDLLLGLHDEAQYLQWNIVTVVRRSSKKKETPPLPIDDTALPPVTAQGG